MAEERRSCQPGERETTDGACVAAALAAEPPSVVDHTIQQPTGEPK